VTAAVVVAAAEGPVVAAGPVAAVEPVVAAAAAGHRPRPDRPDDGTNHLASVRAVG
jgi:hypothetical protein